MTTSTISSESSEAAYAAAAYIKTRCSHLSKPKIAIVLGSGLGDLVNLLEQPTIIPYDTLPGFPETTVYGHQGNLVAGYLAGVSVVCLQGRAHLYEGVNSATIATYVRTLRLLGCEYFIATNAAGSLVPEVGPGELMLITDHINFQGTNPLIGPNDDRFGPRFLPMDNAYPLALRQTILEVAQEENIRLHQGIYLGVLGPNYETAAEIRAFRALGADALGMSTVSEVLVAHHCGMKVAVISTITNFATGIATVSHDHAEVVAVAKKAAVNLSQLIQSVAKVLPTEEPHDQAIPVV